jgi:chorismate mutase/prephenate dehydratase
MSFSERAEIDQIDQQLLELLNRRARIAQSIGRQKHERGMPAYDASREKQVLERIVAASTGPLPNASLRTIYREIMSACRSLEQPITVAFLGPPATFTHMATLQQFGSSVDTVPAATIADVFRIVEHGEAHYGVVPVENSNEGVESHTLDNLVQTDLKICAETYLQVHQCLLSKAPMDAIHTVYSHPNALGQCQEWLRYNLPHANIVPVSSTSRGAELAAEEPHAAAIGAALAAQVYGLDILAERIEDHPNNRTRFLVIGNHESPPTGKDKTSLTFMAPHRPGGLWDALGCFREYGINLTMIVSRPNRVKPFEYRFFVDIQGHAREPHVHQALEAARNHCHAVAVLGSYPEAE